MLASTHDAPPPRHENCSQAEKSWTFFFEHMQRRFSYGFRARVRAAGHLRDAERMQRTSSHDYTRHAQDVQHVMFE